MGKLLYPEESYKIRGACFAVWKELGGGFKESVIERALTIELIDQGLEVEAQKRITILYKHKKVGTYIPDLVVENKIIIELKSKPVLLKQDLQQFWYYLKGSVYKLGFLINFGSHRLQIERRVFDTARMHKSA